MRDEGAFRAIKKLLPTCSGRTCNRLEARFGQVTSAPPTCWNGKAALETVWKLPLFAGKIVNISITSCRVGR